MSTRLIKLINSHISYNPLTKQLLNTANRTQLLVTTKLFYKLSILPFTLHRSIMSTNASNIDHNNMQFGKFKLPLSQIFYISPSGLTYATVNLKPITQGHVLVIPIRNVARLSELTNEEISDLFITSNYISQKLEQHLHTTAFNLGLQDGKDSGQSVPHVHVHIVPRKPSDFERNDDVYDAIDDFDARPVQDGNSNIPTTKKGLIVDDAARKNRTQQDMADEAIEYRKIVGWAPPEHVLQ